MFDSEYDHAFEYDDSAREAYDYDCGICRYCGHRDYDLAYHTCDAMPIREIYYTLTDPGIGLSRRQAILEVLRAKLRYTLYLLKWPLRELELFGQRYRTLGYPPANWKQVIGEAIYQWSWHRGMWWRIKWNIRTLRYHYIKQPFWRIQRRVYRWYELKFHNHDIDDDIPF